MSELSLSRKFALLSLVTIAFITAVQVTVQWLLLREDLLTWERTYTASRIRAEASSSLRPEDFVGWRGAGAQQRFEQFFRRTLANPEILRVKVYDAEMRVVWSDEPRLLGARFPDNHYLADALRGRTVGHLERAEKAENRFEREFNRSVELYVPISLSAATAPGTATVAGVVEIYKDPSPMLSNTVRDRLVIVVTSLAGAAVLYGVLFGIVRSASRQLLARTAALDASNQELRAAQEQLRKSERLAAIGEVSAAVAHGIRNPLASIRAAAQVAATFPDAPPPVEKHLKAVTREVDRLDRWLRALLDFVRPFEPRFAPVNLNALIDDLLTLLGDRLAAREIKIERSLATDLPALAADEVHLQQALLGVLENALDALPPGGTLRVVTERVDAGEHPGVKIAIADNGTGIPAERLGRVFEPFFTTKTKGTGLGLAITRKVVEGHRGRVDVESKPGEGTTFTITLPA